MSNYTLSLSNVTKIFGRRLIFENITYEFVSGNIYGLAGPNGSGKSTLSKILTGLLSTTSGKIQHKINNQVIPEEKLQNHIGFVSSYLVLYDEFSSIENLQHFCAIRGVGYSSERVEYLLNEFNIYDRRNDLLKVYSSGMKQRIKFIFALLHSPQMLLFDEPTSNLDNEGKEKVYRLTKKEAENNLVIIASNEDSDLKLCNKIINISDFKRGIKN
ncbi:MAG: ABC transporter ATP-binding protein [Ignavibacteria bacterium]|jgi:heme exporter protein A